MNDTELFQKHLNRWALICPSGVARIVETPCESCQFFDSHGQLNLQRQEKDEKITYLHSVEDPTEEATAWFSKLSLNTISVLYIYGVGLGYYYEAAKEWLHADHKRNLVFIEDDPAVIHRFFETEKATAFLFDKQVALYFIDDNGSLPSSPLDILCN